MKCTKMQALGNDFIIVETFGADRYIEDAPGLWAKFLCSRHFGIGADGLLLVCPSDSADVRMRIFNPDGTEAEMCGNAIRSVGKYVFDRGIVPRAELTVETLGGVKRIFLELRNRQVQNITAEVGVPVFTPAGVPVLYDGERFADVPVEIGDRTFLVTAMSMGNPHCVSFIEDAARFPLEFYGPRMERHPLFPEKVNAHFAEVLSDTELRLRAYERGVGETMACATGSCVSVVGGYLTGRCGPRAQVLQTGGGVIGVAYDPGGGSLTMTGPSATVFAAEIPPETAELERFA